MENDRRCAKLSEDELKTKNTTTLTTKKGAEESGVRMPKDDKNSIGGDEDREDGENAKDE